MTDLSKNISKARHIDFLGIGGIGMSALARYFNNRNNKITGYDKVKTPLTEKLEEEGIKIRYQKLNGDFELPDLVIYTPAIPVNFEDFVFYKSLEISMYKRAAVLGNISLENKLIAVAGTHGKTSTSAIIVNVPAIGLGTSRSPSWGHVTRCR